MLLAEAHRRDIRLIMDLVLNHTSDQHPWFLESSSSTDNPKKDWYIWHHGRPGSPPRPPTNWMGALGGRAWEWEPARSQFYLHSFAREQPDVNWRNPELREAMYDVIRFWLDLGVDGFRLDIVNWFVHDDQFRDNPYKLGRRPYDMQHHVYDRNHAENIDVMREIRSVVDTYSGRMTIGEVYTEPPGDAELAIQYYDRGKGLHMAFNFAFLYCPWSAACFARSIEQWESLLNPDGLWPNYTLSNHDQPRAISRYAKSDETGARARVTAALLLTVRGTPFLYYGEEIGMHDTKIPRSRLQDPVGKRYWPFNPGRDPARTPMQWDDTLNAGFTTGKPWLPVNENYREINAAAQEEDAFSLLNWYRQLLRLRRRCAALQQGDYRACAGTKDVLVYERVLEDDRLLILLNFAGSKRSVLLPESNGWRVLLEHPGDHETSLAGSDVVLEPYAVIIAESITAL